MFEGDVGERPRDVAPTETVGDLFDAIVSKAATVPENATLRDAVDAILKAGVTRKAYVVDGGGIVRGTITVETLMRHVSYRLGARPPGVMSFLRFVREMETDNVNTFMAKASTVRRETKIFDVVRRVVEDHLNDFPVVDEEGRLLGELNTLDLLRATRSVFKR
jgi:CBS-domain-containing membrane protein